MSEYLILLTPFLSAAIAQALKIILSKRNKMSIKDFFAFTYSGMPSGHSAFVISLVVIMGLMEGLKSPIFALTLIFAVIVINDALKLRMYIGQQGGIINVLVEDLSEDQFLDQKYPKMIDRVGHTKTEVLAGSIIGTIVSLISYFLFF